MTFLSCLVIGIAFLLAVGLLLFAAFMLGWYVPEMIERARRAGRALAPQPPPKPGEATGGGPGVIDPPAPRP